MTDGTYSITETGRKALTDESLQGVELLMAEIIARTGNITKEDATNIFWELVDWYGTPEAAIEAMRSGDVRFEKLLES
jgi:hypothetical protein